MTDQLIKVGGAWKSIDDCKVKVASAWKQVDTIYCKVGGAWKEVWNNLVISLDVSSNISQDDTAGNGYYALVGLKVLRDGTVEQASGNTGSPLSYTFRENWAEPPSATIGDAYHVRVTNNGETGAAGTDTGTFGSWLALTSDRTWTWQKDTDVSGTATLSVTVAISDDGGSTTLTSVSFDMVAQESL